MSKNQPGFLGSLIIFFVIAACGLAADLGTKTWAFANYYPYYQDLEYGPVDNAPHWLIDGVLGIQTSTNGGALFGVMQGFQIVFIVLSVFAMLAILAWLFFFRGWQDRLLVFCLSMISGGILGNLYDRLGLWHQSETPPDAYREVRDWIHFRLAGVPYFDPWPNFNIADSLLVVGVGIMLIQSLFAPAQATTSEETDNQSESES